MVYTLSTPNQRESVGDLTGCVHVVYPLGMAQHKHIWDYYGCSMGFFKRCWGCDEVQRSSARRVAEERAKERENGSAS